MIQLRVKRFPKCGVDVMPIFPVVEDLCVVVAKSNWIRLFSGEKVYMVSYIDSFSCYGWVSDTEISWKRY